jgi:UDP-N-acetylglucosamine--N-acetylmuramyl-(pentapeptide) pyrophosphoryl-undecaprenol N-acetylglucosamine transferase
MRIILTGGGSGGPVTPLLAVAQEIRKLKPKAEFLFVGTRSGPAQLLVGDFGISFKAIPAAKWRRYLSLRNFFDIFVFIYSLIAAFNILRKFKPDVIFSAGGFVAVPISWVGRLLGARIVIHQQDAQIGLANKLILPFAHKITTALEYTSKQVYSGSGLFNRKWRPGADWVGNPVRQELLAQITADKKQFGLHDKLPILLILGGAAGAVQINDVVELCLPELLKSHQVIHQTGQGKRVDFEHPDYHQYDFLPFEQYVPALKLADLVIARAGLSTITELATLGKIAIIVPMPGSHQEENAQILKNLSAAIVLDKNEFNQIDLPRIVTSIKFNIGRQKLLADNIRGLFPKDAAAKIAKIIVKVD